ncbi:MAG: DUF4338 domain-containing protein [Candidatus Thiodiazotropha sp. (ex Codakia orbicularis)]|nr:DUF4338 domain-containing protein [Candidatus Thiodiazotropha sp. (ex Codakia orbicularis)]
MAKVVEIQTRKASLKRRFRRHLKNLGFHKTADGMLEIDGTGKDVIRSLHAGQRTERLTQNKQFIKDHYKKLSGYFASGNDIDPTKISPVLQRIRSDTKESRLFRLASLTWSVPVSNGFGRRIRYLVWDQHNDKLIGLIAIGDPVFNLSVRDKLIGWNSEDRSERLVNIMDAYVLGAVAPYNMLLGGKLVACMVRSRDIYNDFLDKYGNTKGIISGKKKKARLLAVMTSSSLGRSSVYNRLKLDGTPYFKSIGYTSGWGHFHIPDKLFLDLREYLREIDHPYADLNRFGQGPNWRLRTTRAALEALGFKDDLLKHGIQREVFFSEFATNALRMLQTGKGRPDLKTLLTADDVADLAIERWIVPRARRQPEYLTWSTDNLKSLLSTSYKSTQIRSLAR